MNRLPIRIAATLLCVCAAFTLANCGPSAPPCVVPAAGSSAMELLEGTWTVRAYDGTMDGDITFADGSLSTRWQDVTLVGTWEHVASLDNAHVIRLRIDEAWENDLRTRFSRFDEVELELVFGNRDHLYALQPDGAWTEWERVTPELPPETEE